MLFFSFSFLLFIKESCKEYCLRRHLCWSVATCLAGTALVGFHSRWDNSVHTTKAAQILEVNHSFLTLFLSWHLGSGLLTFPSSVGCIRRQTLGAADSSAVLSQGQRSCSWLPDHSLGGNSLCQEGHNHMDFLQEMKTFLAEVLRMFPRKGSCFQAFCPIWIGKVKLAGQPTASRRAGGGLTGQCLVSWQRDRCIGLPHLIIDGVHLSPGENEQLLSNIWEALQVELQRWSHQISFWGQQQQLF